ncbi:protease inhibitor I9 family protein [Luedemannella flava]|uniref:protease inhibitor I9 family protein n=1 Tax=Luedemannella flava TaxID=349316 RepID=UPI0031DB7922
MPAGRDVVAGQYIVVYKDGTSATVGERVEDGAKGRGGRIAHKDGKSINGFSAKLSDAALAEVRSDPAVAYVEADVTVSVEETAASWGLDRVNQRSLPLDTERHLVRQRDRDRAVGSEWRRSGARRLQR